MFRPETFMRRAALGWPMIALADVAVVVSDARASTGWWERNLGFATHTVGGGGHAILVAPPGDRFVLHLCQGFAPIEPGDTGIAFVTDRMDSLVARMTRGGVSFPEPLRREEWGRMAKFADPDGNVFWLIEVSSTMARDTLNLRAPSRAVPAAERADRPKRRRATTRRKPVSRPRRRG